MKEINQEYYDQVTCEMHGNRLCKRQNCNLGFFKQHTLYNWRKVNGNPNWKWIFNPKCGNTTVKVPKNYL